MRKFEATTLDFYDDGGKILKELVNNPQEIPDFVKVAQAVDQKSHSELFALALHEDGKVLKKFATADAGNTWLSTLYFYETHDRLPLEAQKVASANLIDACENFGIEIPEFLYEIADGPVEGNFVDVTDKAPPMQKSASAVEREDVVYAIERSDGSKYYPLKDAKSVKVASEYFSENYRNMVPRERREYAVKVASVAKKAAMPLPDVLRKYASSSVSPNVEAHLTSRYLYLVDSDANPEIRNRLVKLASVRNSVQADDLASALEQFDRETGLDNLWDSLISDPYYSVFALEKVAKGAVEAPESFDLDDNTTVTTQELMWLGERGKKQMVHNFGWDVANAFEKDPVAIFKSMPTPQKKVIARMASSYSPVAGQ